MATLVRTTESFACSDGFKMPGYLTRPGSVQRLPAVVLVFEIFGFTAEMRRVSDEFAAEGFVVFMPDLFSRGSWFSCVRKAMKDLESGSGQGVEDLKAAREWLSGQAFVDGGHVGIAGFCMGGAFALLLAKTGLFQVAAPFYGKAPERLDGACPLVASYGGRDKVLAPEAAKIEAEAQRLNIPHDVKVYPEAGHSFMNHAPNVVLGWLEKISPMHGGYDAAVAADAKRRVVAFFREHL